MTLFTIQNAVRRAGRVRWPVLVAAVALAAAGCGSATSWSGTTQSARPASLPLTTSVSAGQASWAVLPMGDRSGVNRFWQLFVLGQGSSHWALVTPPDIATNAAIAVGVTGSQSAVSGVRPSQLLRFSPLVSTANGGRAWAAGAPSPSLANVPDALAGAPDGHQVIVLGHDGKAALARTAQSAFTTLASPHTLAVTPAGGACEPRLLTAVAFSPAGQPVVAARCSTPGTVGLFARSGTSWHAAGPALPDSLRKQPVEVLRLVRAGDTLTALLQVGTGPAARLLAAWANPAGHWTLSAPAPVTRPVVASSSVGADGSLAVQLASGHAQYLAGPGAAWQALPALPAGHAVVLALPAGGQIEALTADLSLLTVWRLQPGAKGQPLSAGQWTKTQTSKIPIQYGSSS
jgi:hypothetical protein